MTHVSLDSLAVGFCVRCQQMPVALPAGDVLCVEFDADGPCAPGGKRGDIHRGTDSYTGPRDDVVATLRSLGFVVAEGEES